MRRFREIADANGALLMMDMAHISGLVATEEANNPFEVCGARLTPPPPAASCTRWESCSHCGVGLCFPVAPQFCDVVTTTTHKSLRGPRSGMIFYRKDARKFGPAINAAVFPGLQVRAPCTLVTLL